MSENPGETSLLAKVASAEKKLLATYDLIPVKVWGFDDEIQERMRQRKHSMVNQKLSKNERKFLNNKTKGFVARELGVNETISDVFNFLSGCKGFNQNLKTPKLVKPDKKPETTSKKDKQVTKTLSSVANDEESSSDEEFDGEAATPAIKSAVATSTKPIAAVKPTIRSSVNKADSDQEIEEDDEDETDEETEEVKIAGKGKKRKSAVNSSTAVKKSKLDKQIEKFDNVDPIELNSIENRQLALLKLQKRIEEMKVNRTNKKADAGTKVADAVAQKKLKRRMSKLQLKQKRAEEKKKAKEENPPPAKIAKKEDSTEIMNDEGNLVFSKFDFIVKDQKKRLSTSEKKDKFTGKDYRSLLHKAETRKEKLDKLKEDDPEKAKQIEEDIKWNRAIKKAEGVKVKDNMELLKKGLKKKEKAKQKRLAKWESRVGKVNADKQHRQEKRDSNIGKRAEDKKKKQIAKLRKKGRIL